jgi:hypothetical protein
MLAELKKDNLAVIQFVRSSRGPLFLVLFELAQPPCIKQRLFLALHFIHVYFSALLHLITIP